MVRRATACGAANQGACGSATFGDSGGVVWCAESGDWSGHRFEEIDTTLVIANVGGCRTKPSEKCCGGLAEAHSRAAVRDDLATPGRFPRMR
jgi:hypothetical protein